MKTLPPNLVRLRRRGSLSRKELSVDRRRRADLIDAGFYARQHNAIARVCHANSVRPSVCLSVCPSVTRVYCIKTAQRIIEILSLSDRPIIVVFRHQGVLRKSDGFIPSGGAEYKGVAIFDQYAAISRKR